jgi:lipoprotein-anchoring transpeptidase ErfK/SrfK
MRTCALLLAVLLAAPLLDAAPASGKGKNGPLARLFSGERKAEKTKRTYAGPAKEERRLGLGGPKRVEIDLTNQRLRAYEGNRLVMESRISSGRGRSTPPGRYTAGPYKAANHYSSLYNNAHMPWSVQVTGHYFIHGFSSVPDYPASHGCIRLPITGNNPARRFFEWVDVGTPIHIFY